ncbi:interferon-inducible GTPase 1-like [Mya arenaria]|nr:interferon-inducible GTPase 1-like [Mya arenaria]
MLVRSHAKKDDSHQTGNLSEANTIASKMQHVLEQKTKKDEPMGKHISLVRDHAAKVESKQTGNFSEAETIARDMQPELRTKKKLETPDDDNDRDLTEDEIQGYVAADAQGGIHALQDMIQRKSNKWKHMKVSFAVIGETGAGKSSFINAMLGLTADDDSFAKVNCTQTTMKAEEYKHHDNTSLSFWDLPGVGTSDFPQETYLEQIEFNKFDFFIMVTHGSFKKNELWLIKEIEKRERKLYFVRTKIDSDILNDKADHPRTHDQKILQENIKTKLHTELYLAGVENIEIFLFNNHWRGVSSTPCEPYDFEILVDRLLADVPKQKKQALLFSFSARSSHLIKEKVKELESRITYVAVGASLASLVPISGAGFAVEIGAIIREINLYKEQLKTDERSMRMLADRMDIPLRELCQKTHVKTHVIYAGASASQRFLITLFAEIATSKVAESALKSGVPIIGSNIPALASIPICALTLRKLLKTCEEEAFRVLEEKWSLEATNTPL